MAPNEPRELTKEKGIWWCDILEPVVGAGMIIASLVAIVMMIRAKAGWGMYLFGIILFLFCLAVGGMMMGEAWQNLKKSKQQG